MSSVLISSSFLHLISFFSKNSSTVVYPFHQCLIFNGQSHLNLDSNSGRKNLEKSNVSDF